LTADGRPAEAKPYTLNLVSRYPENRVFLWQLVDVYLALKDYPGAIQASRTLFDNVSKNQPNCCTNLVQAKLKMAQAYFGAGDYQTTAQLCQEILQVPECRDQSIGFSEAIADAKKLLKKAEAKL